MAHGGVDRLRVARGWAVTSTVAGSAEVRAALDHHARNPDRRLARIVTLFLPAAARVLGDAASLRRVGRVLRRIPVTRPFPDVADHVAKAVAVRRESADWGRALVGVWREVLVRELALPGVRHLATVRHELVAP